MEFDSATTRAWATVFAAICIQAAPFVVLGALLAALVGAVPVARMARLVPRRRALAVPSLALAGMTLPGCECGSVPTAAGLAARGVGVGPSVAFMAAAPVANPVVLVATSAAYPGQPVMVAARLVSGLLVATCLGLLASGNVFGPPRLPAPHEHAGKRVHGLLADAAVETLNSFGWLSIGAAAAAAFTVWLPRGWFAPVQDKAVLGVVAAAGLAVVLSICSQADAFVARSVVGFSRTAELAFMVVGSTIDLKVAAMQAGAFGSRFALRLGAAALLAGVAVTVGVASVLL